MTTHNTGNPIGSVAVKDLYDNAQNLDVAVNSLTELTWIDRLGNVRKTWRSVEMSAPIAVAAAEEARAAADEARAAAEAARTPRIVVTAAGENTVPLPIAWRGKRVRVRMVGGGGGGGGGAAGIGTTPQTYVSGGGGAGGGAGQYIETEIMLPNAASIVVTIGLRGEGGAGAPIGVGKGEPGGTGGITDIDGIISASGGYGGGGAGGDTTHSLIWGGNANGSNGNPGGNGSAATGTPQGPDQTYFAPPPGVGGVGGESPFGRGGGAAARSVTGLPAQTGGVGRAADPSSGGGGGGGSGNYGYGAAAGSGGNGANGQVILELI